MLSCFIEPDLIKKPYRVRTSYKCLFSFLFVQPCRPKPGEEEIEYVREHKGGHRLIDPASEAQARARAPNAIYIGIHYRTVSCRIY